MREEDVVKVFSLLDELVPSLKVPVVDFVNQSSRDPFKVLVATVISARTKDEVTAKAVERLFSRVSSPEDLSSLSVDEIASLIYPAGFFRVKARNLKLLAQRLISDFGGVVPDSLDSLLSLPGVGRKTANLVLAVAFNKPAICVDTHVHRITNRWGFVSTSSPFETEMALRQKLPRRFWRKINFYLVAFGQGVCKPVSPSCGSCPLTRFCDYYSSVVKKSVNKKSLKK